MISARDHVISVTETRFGFLTVSTMSHSDPQWCCLCEDPFEDPMTPPITFPIIPCHPCAERTRAEVERCIWSGRKWTCPHRKHNDPNCTYCEDLVSSVDARTRQSHSLRTLALRATMRTELHAMKDIFFAGHPIWEDVDHERRFSQFNKCKVRGRCKRGMVT